MSIDMTKLVWTKAGIAGNLEILRAERQRLREEIDGVQALITATYQLCPHRNFRGDGDPRDPGGGRCLDCGYVR